MRTYQPIWHRIRANPNKYVPIEVPDAFVARISKAVTKEKDEDLLYKNIRKSQGRFGIIYKKREPHPSKAGLVRLIFMLREFTIMTDSSFINKTGLKYLVKHPPSATLAEELGFETMPAVPFNAVPLSLPLALLSPVSQDSSISFVTATATTTETTIGANDAITQRNNYS